MSENCTCKRELHICMNCTEEKQWWWKRLGLCSMPGEPLWVRALKVINNTCNWIWIQTGSQWSYFKMGMCSSMVSCAVPHWSHCDRFPFLNYHLLQLNGTPFSSVSSLPPSELIPFLFTVTLVHGSLILQPSSSWFLRYFLFHSLTGALLITKGKKEERTKRTSLDSPGLAHSSEMVHLANKLAHDPPI